MARYSEYRFQQIEGAEMKWLVEASDLNWQPGVWPDEFSVVPVVGADIVFQKQRKVQKGGYLYVSSDGRSIEVLND